MKHGIASILLALYLFPAQLLDAAELDPVYTCVGWLNRSDDAQVSLILGWLLAIQAADSMTSEAIMPQLWPSGHRVGGVQLELVVACQKRENRNRSIVILLVEIAKRLNGIGSTPNP